MKSVQFFYTAAAILAAVLVVNPVGASQCTEDCDLVSPSENPDNPIITFCGTDGRNYTTTATALFCYDYQCNIAVVHAGTCACPNNCSSGVHGVCAPDGTRCMCQPGWGGRDCNSVECPANSCSGHGFCMTFGGFEAPLGHCQCVDGFTGPDCSQPMLEYSDTPWGCILPAVYPGHSCTGQKHKDIPWFSFKELPSIHLRMPPAEYVALISPLNRTSEVYYNTSVTFVSNEVAEMFPAVGFRLHGAAARANPKKGYTLKFDEFMESKKGWKKIFLKNSYGPVGAQFLTTLLMSASVPVQRSSFALFYINDVFTGVYTLLPDFTKDFIHGWYGQHSGNFYKMGSSCWFAWREDAKHTGKGHCCDQRMGSGNTSDYVDLVKFLRFSNDTEFENRITDVVDMEGIVRMEVATSFIQLLDGFTDNGNNYQCYHYNNSDSSIVKSRQANQIAGKAALADATELLVAAEGERLPEWSCFARDFDSVFALTKIRNIFQWPTYSEFKNIGWPEKQNPLLNRAFPLPSINASYVSTYKALLDPIFSPPTGTANHTSPHDWYLAIAKFIAPMSALDDQGKLFCYRSCNMTWLALRDADWLHERYHYVSGLLGQ